MGSGAGSRVGTGVRAGLQSAEAVVWASGHHSVSPWRSAVAAVISNAGCPFVGIALGSWVLIYFAGRVLFYTIMGCDRPVTSDHRRV